MMNEKIEGDVLVILSGGQDSTTCLFWAKETFTGDVYAVTYDYGQRHKREITAALRVAGMANIKEHITVKVGSILQGASPLVSQNKLEQYPDHNSLPGGLEKTFVPGRNLLFLTLAANHAYARGITNVVTGVCEEDYGGYPDCRREFIDSAETTIRLGFGDKLANDGTEEFFHKFRIHTPLMSATKADTVRLARCLPGCWEALAYTHTAYDGAYPPTGKDHATLLREKGFLEAGFPDPLVVRAVAEGLMDIPDLPNYANLRE